MMEKIEPFLGGEKKPSTPDLKLLKDKGMLKYFKIKKKRRMKNKF